MRTAATILFAAILSSPTMAAGQVIPPTVFVMTEAYVDAVSCCGFGTGTTTVASYSLTYSNVQPHEVGAEIEWEFSTRLKCGDPGGSKKLLDSRSEGLRQNGNSVTGTFTGQEECPFGIRSRLVVDKEQTPPTPGQGHIRNSINCAQPCEGLLCDDEGGGSPPSSGL